MDQLKNMEEKELGKASPLTGGSATDTSRVCSNRRSREAECSGGPGPLQEQEGI